ncbi:MAG: rhomboid family intramembrane serine protease [Chloroflexi bacterium]|nr:rhomboid family intramembrane serine protease [Chloroflexota bacterium]
MIPIHDSVRARSFPYVNVAIIAVNFIVFLYEVALSQQGVRGQFTELDTFIYHWGNIPACTFDALGRDAQLSQLGASICGSQPEPSWTVFSAMFMHGSWLHIMGNMLFLWIFGDNVEDSMGHALYGVFYLLVGALSAFTHMFVNANELMPAIGASGAIAGVMGAYIVLFPRATVAVLIPPLFFLPLPLPAFLLIGFWFLAQLFSGVSSLGVDAVGAGGGVAYFAHIGGFIAGAALVNIFAVRRRRARH